MEESLMSFEPVVASNNIVEKYKRYLKTIFDISDENYRKQFIKELENQNTFSAGPYLDVTDSFVKGKSIMDLVNEGILAKGFYNIKMPSERPLYKHQEEAVIKSINGKNIVVSTGTGSGKTESFLIPIFNHIIREYETGILGAGVRALLIYPMNALANDQVERLRELLEKYPQITFGSYTGQTKHEFEKALVEYKSLNNGQVPKINELISREQIKEKPPHILITNYAMLEYLMLRPDDSVFFSRENADKWKYIVLDEAHVYNGSTGIEVSMLLRRVKALLENNKIQYILTSATLGGDKDNKEVAQFACSLCDADFKESDIIRAKRIRHVNIEEKYELGHEFYDRIFKMLDEGISEDIICSEIKSKFKINESNMNLTTMLYHVVLHDITYWNIKRLMQKPRTVESLAASLGWSRQSISNFVTVASKCDLDGDRLFDSRYHMFLKATDGVYITLKPSSKLFLTRKERHYENDLDYIVFEIATCTSCHSIYLIGKEENNYLVQTSNFESYKYVYLLSDSVSDTDEDHKLEDENLETEEYEICSRCGYLHKLGARNESLCEHGKTYCVKVIKIRIKNKDGRLTKCPACENTSSYGMLRTFFTGQEAVTSVIGTALFEELPSYKIVQEISIENDDTGFGSDEDYSAIRKVKEAKQFLAFSDNRQGAAFYATYLEQTYRNILYKRLIVETLKGKDYDNRKKKVDIFVKDLMFQFEKYEIASKEQDITKNEAWKAILQELIDNKGNTSLSNMGLIGISVNDDIIPPNNKYNLSSKEVATLINVFLLGMMQDAAIYYNVPLDKADKEYFTHNGLEFTYTYSDSNKKTYTRSFIPKSEKYYNKRLDYLMRVLNKKGFTIDRNIAINMLKSIWDRILCNPDKEILVSNNGKYRINSEKIFISREKDWYYCNKCRKITMHNINNVCPTYKCDGELTKINIDDEFRNNHYYKIYQNLDIRDLRIVEHTAQLNRETAYEYQKKFKAKEIDILSCSTTFEMGVDVGTLETVFMRNMPPSPANYAQRAGRAGRSKHSAAYAVTFCNKSNHDFTFFRNPEKMIKGNINPPRFNVENEKIAIRHVYASAFSFFWKRYPMYFYTASTLAETDENGSSGFIKFKEYILSEPGDLKDFIKRFLPKKLTKKLGANSYSWSDRLFSTDEDQPGVLTKAIAEYDYEVGIIQEAINRVVDNKTYRGIGRLSERLKVYRNEEILTFLSRKNVLPKYGFPVDTVEMTIVDTSGNSKLGLQLQRDLSIAISEYAPGSQIIANGNLITSKYIRKIPRMSWKQYDYIICEKCNTLNISPKVIEDEHSELQSCRQCKNNFNVAKRKTFLVPEFGFEADNKIEKPGLIKPERTYRNEIAYVGYKNVIDFNKYEIQDATVELGISSADEMAILNESNFFVCETCGYTDLDDKVYTNTKIQKHKYSSGYDCKNDRLRKYSIGYRFETDVLQLRFLNPDLQEWDVAYSVLHGILKGICSYLNIEEDDISGCLRYFFNDATYRGNYSLIFYDKTPGGAGHVRRVINENVIECVLRETLKIMQQCDCGGEDGDTSCYSCLRNYYNQKYHDRLKRFYVVDFLTEVLGSQELALNV